MPPRLALIAALPREIAALVRGTRPETALLASGIHLHRLSGAIVVAAGMGSERVARAVEAALAAGNQIEMLISVGLAGACSRSLQPGEVVTPGVVVNARTGERFPAEAAHSGPVLVTADSIASVSEKARLAASYGAALVDMEAATVARLALAQGLRFKAIKAVSDAHDFELASMERFSGKHGHFRTGAFALHTALRPHRWRGTIRLGRDSSRALVALELHLRALIAESAGT